MAIKKNKLIVLVFFFLLFGIVATSGAGRRVRSFASIKVSIKELKQTVNGQNVRGSGTVAMDPPNVICSKAAKPNCTQSYARGTVVDLVANPEWGSVFVQWRGKNCSGGPAAKTITLDISRLCEAVFGMVVPPTTTSTTTTTTTTSTTTTTRTSTTTTSTTSTSTTTTTTRTTTTTTTTSTTTTSTTSTSTTTTTTLIPISDTVRKSVRGLYALGKPGRLFSQSVAENPYVDGLAIRTHWGAIEPVEGEYNWSDLDASLEQARQLGKKASLSISAGRATPDWVYKTGAQSFTFIDSNPYHKDSFCTLVTIPIPYDPIFLIKWKNFIRVVGARYNNQPVLTQVRITGINKSTAETILPHDMGDIITNCDKTSNDIQNWINVGYTATLIKNTWSDIAATYKQAFTNKAFAVALSPKGLPRINDFGQYETNLDLNREILELGRANMGGSFIPQNNGLSARWDYDLVTDAAVHSIVGYQMRWFVTGDTTYRMNDKVAGDPKTIFESAINRGINAGATYLEIYSNDIDNPDFQDILSRGHQGIWSVP